MFLKASFLSGYSQQHNTNTLLFQVAAVPPYFLFSLPPLCPTCRLSRWEEEEEEALL